MIRLAVSVKAGFKKTAERKGGIMVEAAMVLPVSCLIVFSLVGLIMTFYGQVKTQTYNHERAAAEWQIFDSIEGIRRYERFIDWIY